MEEFNGSISSMEIEEVGVVGRNFSWFSLDGLASSRLDRFLFSERLLDLWKVENQIIGNRELSYHCPIWFKGNVCNWDPKPFKFFNAWTKHADFYSFVEEAWMASLRGNKAIFSFKEKLKFLHGKLHTWNVEVLVFLIFKKRRLLKILMLWTLFWRMMISLMLSLWFVIVLWLLRRFRK